MKKILSFSFILILSHLIFAQSQRPLNTRTFLTTNGIDNFGFLKHSNLDNSEIYFSSRPFSSIAGSFNIRKYKNDGLLKWKSSISLSTDLDLSLSKKYMAVDNFDNVVLLSSPKSDISGVRKYTDPNGVVEILSEDKPSVIKIDKDGILIFAKSLDFVNKKSFSKSVYCDSSGDIYVLGVDQKVINGDDVNSFFIVKINGTNGEQIFLKNYENITVNSATLTFDAADNFYIFLDSYTFQTNFNFDGITIEPNGVSNNIFLKYDKTGNIILGKNFHQYVSGKIGYSIVSDATFDGQDLVLTGYLSSTSMRDYRGLDDVIIPWKYAQTSRQGLIAKISTDGNVIWQKPIYSDTNLDKGMWTNIQTDENKDIYGYFFFRGKINYNEIVYQFDLTAGNKVVSKLNSVGNVLYFDSVDKTLGYPQDQSSMMFDLISEDVFNVSGVTTENNFLAYPTEHYYASASYIATFGNLSKKYLTPENNYLELTAANIPNNPAPTVNEFSFTLVNNVNWTATSDQSWLNLSSISLTSKSPQQTITGNGDAKITLTADQNTTGLLRSSNVIISGEGVPSKTVIVSQTATLGINNNALSIITMYPNPTSDFLNIKSDQKISKIEIYDMSGKLVQTSKMNNEKVSVSKLPKGNYLIKLQTENGVVNSKFIKN